MYATPVLCGPLSALVVVSPSETKYDLGELLSQTRGIMSAQPQPYLTPQEYLAFERQADYKTEYFQGETFAMARTSHQTSS